MCLIAWAVYHLAGIRVHEQYAYTMKFILVVAVAGCLEALHGHFIYDTPVPIGLLLAVFGMVAMVATTVFCVAMRWLCEEAGLYRPAKRRRTTTLLFAIIYLIPLGLLYGAIAVAMATGSHFHFDLGPAGLLLLPVFFVPFIHLLVSTHHMRVEAEKRPDTDPGSYSPLAPSEPLPRP